MERLIKEIIQIEKKRNSLLAEINKSLKIIANIVENYLVSSFV